MAVDFECRLKYEDMDEADNWQWLCFSNVDSFVTNKERISGCQLFAFSGLGRNPSGDREQAILGNLRGDLLSGIVL